MEFQRPSILHRPLRNGSQATKETAHIQWEREQEALRRKAATKQEHLDRLTQSLYPTEESKLAAAVEAQRQLQAHQAARLQAQMMERQKEEQQERLWADPSKVMSPRSTEPWRNPSAYYSTEEEERAARRRLEAEVCTANMVAARERAYEMQRQKAEEDQAAKRLLTGQSHFWNLGASNDRWVAPEHRLHSPNGPKQPASVPSHPPVWSWASEEVAKTYVPPPVSGINCRSPSSNDQTRPKTPWALDDEIDAAAGGAHQPQSNPRFQSRPASAVHTGARAVPWATELDQSVPPAPPSGRKHVQYLPQKPEGFGARVQREWPF